MGRISETTVYYWGTNIIKNAGLRKVLKNSISRIISRWKNAAKIFFKFFRDFFKKRKNKKEERNVGVSMPFNLSL